MGNRMNFHERMYSQLVLRSPDGIVVHKQGRIVFANAAALRLLGCDDPRDLIDTPVLDRVHPDHREIVSRRIEETKRTNLPCPVIEEEFLRMDGSSFEVEVNGAALADEDGAAVQVLFRDISERNRRRTLVKTLQSRYRNLLKTALDGFHVLDKDGRLVEANPAFCRMLGYTRAEMKQLTVFDWDAQWTKEDLRRKIAPDAPSGTLFETRHQRRDGNFIDVEISTNSVELGDERVLFASARDITERKRLQEKEQREVRMESLGALASGVAHDFRNILMGLSAHLELMRLRLQDNRVSESLDCLARTGDAIVRGKALTDQLLDFSTGGVPVKARTELGSVLKEWVDFVLRGFDLSAETQIDKGLWSCCCDKNQIGQVITNLLINACQASTSGASISVRAFNAWLDQDYVAIAIEDQGSGIPGELLPKIFDPLFTTKATGTGLGLSVSHTIVTQHGGRLEVDSTVGQGTTFTVYLPAIFETRSKGDC